MYKKIIQTAQEQQTQKVQKTVKITQIRDREHSDGFFQLENGGAMKSQSRSRISMLSQLSYKDSRDEQKTFYHHQRGSQTEHCRHSFGNATTGACDSEGTENGGYPMASVQ